MKRIIAVVLAAALLLAVVPAAFAATPEQTVLPEGNEFSFNNGTGWGNAGRWSSGRSNTEGLWAQSDAKDGSGAAAAYVGQKLNGSWSFNAQLAPLSSSNGDGRIVSRVQLLDQYKNPKVILTYEYISGTKQTALKWETISSANGGSWLTLFKLDWTKFADTSLNFRISKFSSTMLTLEITGNQGYRKTMTCNVPQDVVSTLCYGGLAAERSTARFGNVRLSVPAADADFTAAAETAYQNLMKNFLIDGEDRLKPVVYGMVSGDVTNAGYTVKVLSAGDFWESAVALMAMDTYAKYHDKSSEAYQKTAVRIANTVNFFVTTYGEAKLTTAGVAPVNHAMDDCGWNVMALLLGYRYNLELGRTSEAATCLNYAEKLFNNTFDHYYDDRLGGGMWYNNDHTEKSLYAATLAMAGYDLWKITAKEDIRERYLKIYEGVENNLRRADGLYYIHINSEGVASKDNPYDISEGGSCTYIGGNMCMAVLNYRLGNVDQAKTTAEGIALFETTRSGALLNDRDAWNNTFFLGMFQRELMQTGVVDARYADILRTTAVNILANAVFDDGYYSAAWEGPKEPLSNGYPKDYPMEARNRWGTQVNQGGYFIGSTPNQIMTTATTIHVLFAAAAMAEQTTVPALETLSVDGKTLWPVFNPDITTYRLLEASDAALKLHWTLPDGQTVTLNGEQQEGTEAALDAAVNKAVLTVKPVNGETTRTYTLVIREVCEHPETETVTVPATCTKPGSETTVCKICGVELNQTTIPATGHQHTREDTIPATCVAAGSITVVCTDCGATVSTQIIPATGHHFTDGVCSVCGEREPEKGCDGGADCPSHAFDDLDRTQWYHTGVDYCVEHGLMNGIAPTRFDPESSVTRAMLVTILYRTEGKPAVTGKTNPFHDVPNGEWYTDAVVWAAAQGIVNGVSETSFAPDDSITREQIATILYRYAKGEPPKMNVLATFADVGSVSGYARDAVNWAVDQGIINGMDGRLAPIEGATRAQIATILARFLAK